MKKNALSRLLVASLTVAIVLLAAASASAAEAPGSSRVLVHNTFDHPTNAWTGFKVAGGHATLTCRSLQKYKSNVALLRTPLPIPRAGQALRVQLTIAGMRDARGGVLDASARIFLAPSPLPDYADPYLLKNTLWLYLQYKDGRPGSITLFRKADQKHFGTALYSASLKGVAFPLQVTLTVSPTGYRIRFVPDLKTDKGARSGKHGLDAARWKGRKVRLGIRAVNERDGVQTQLTLNEVKITLVDVAQASAASTNSSARSADTGNSSAKGRKTTAVTVKVWPRLTESVGGIDRVPGLFGVTVNGATRGQAVSEVRALNLNSARAFLWPLQFWPAAPKDFVKPPITPGEASQYGKGPAASPGQVARQYDAYYQQDFSRLMKQWWNDVGSTQPQAIQVDLFRKWGLTQDLVFHTQVDGSALKHPKAVRRYYAAYLDMLHAHAPALRPRFVELTNEPNYPWFGWQFSSQHQAAQAWIKIFNQLDGYLRQAYPETRLLGPTLASTAFFSWDDWQAWTVPVLKQVKYPLHYFDYHCYNVPAYTQLAWMEMLQAQAGALGRPRPRAVITEMNYALNKSSPAASRKRFQWWAQQLFVSLAHPDKFDILNYFLLGYRSFSHANLLRKEDGKWIPSRTYWLYWTLAHLRGRYVHVQPAGSPGLQIIGAAPDAKTLVVGIFNNSDHPQRVTVDWPTDSPPRAGSLVMRWAHDGPGGRIEHGQRMLAQDKAPQVLVPPGGVDALEWHFADALAPERTLKETEFYSRTVAKRFHDNLPCTLRVTRLPADDETVSVRLGVYSDNLLAASGLDLVFNGRKIPLYWNQAPRQVQRDQRTVWWMSVPVDRSEVRRVNHIVLANPDTAYRLMFASVVYRQQPSAQVARAMTAQAQADRQARIRYSVKSPGYLLAGKRKPLTLTVDNRDTRSRTYQLSISLPASLRWVGQSQKKWTFTVRPHQARRWQSVVEGLPVKTTTSGTIAVHIAGKGLTGRNTKLPVTVYPRYVVPFLTRPVRIDGNLQDWTDRPALISFAGSGLKVRAWLGWNRENLYLAADVQSATSPQPPPGVASFWNGDCLEAFVDLTNSRTRHYDADDAQLFFCPVGSTKPGQAIGGRVIRKIKGDAVRIRGSVIDARLRTAALTSSSGYQLEAAIPFAVIDAAFHPRQGMRLGFNLALDHPGHGKQPPFSNSVMGLKTKAYARPDQWPIVILGRVKHSAVAVD